MVKLIFLGIHTHCLHRHTEEVDRPHKGLVLVPFYSWENRSLDYGTQGHRDGKCRHSSESAYTFNTIVFLIGVYLLYHVVLLCSSEPAVWSWPFLLCYNLLWASAASFIVFSKFCLYQVVDFHYFFLLWVFFFLLPLVSKLKFSGSWISRSEFLGLPAFK